MKGSPVANLTQMSDAKFLNWSDNFEGVAGKDPESLGLTQTAISDFGTLVETFRTAYERTVEPSTKTPVATAEKRIARTALLADARRLVSIIDGQANVTDAQRVALGLNVRKPSKPVERPKSRPLIEVLTAVGNKASIRLLDAGDTNRRGKPEFCIGATVFSYVGPAAPDQENEWVYEGNTSKTTLTVAFPQSLPPGTRVWFTAFWYNRRAESGDPAVPVCTNLPGGAAMARAA